MHVIPPNPRRKQSQSHQDLKTRIPKTIDDTTEPALDILVSLPITFEVPPSTTALTTEVSISMPFTTLIDTHVVSQHMSSVETSHVEASHVEYSVYTSNMDTRFTQSMDKEHNTTSPLLHHKFPLYLTPPLHLLMIFPTPLRIMSTLMLNPKKITSILPQLCLKMTMLML